MFKIVLILIAVLLMGAIYQFICVIRDNRKYPPLGEMIKIDNRFLHVMRKKIYDHGPTIILEAGNGLSSSSWMLVQPEIEKFANCISYDRAGFGWSKENPNGCTCLNYVEDLHILLSKLEMPKPYILVGHSYGGMLNRLYASQYSEDVAGIILVDAYHEEQLKLIPLPSSRIMIMLSIMSFLGIFRLLIRKLFPLPKYLPEQMKNRIYAENTSYSWIKMMRKIFSNANEIVYLTKNIPISKIQTIIISAGLFSNRESKFKNEICKLQKDLVRKSSNAHQIIAEKSSHNIPFAQPEIIIATIQKLVSKLQRII